MLVYRWLGSLLALVFLVVPADAGPAPAREPDFSALLGDSSTLISWLRARDHELAAAGDRIQEAGAALAESRVFPNPQLDVSLGNLPLAGSNPRGLGFGQYAIFSIGVSQTIELGKRGPRIDAGRLRVRASDDAWQDTLEQRVATARAALGRVLYLAQRQAVLEQSLAAARTMATVAASRLAHGDISGIDDDRLELDTISLGSDVERNRSEYEVALAACQAAVQTPCDPTGAAPDDLDHAAPVPPAVNAAALLTDRPDVRALVDEGAATRADARLARSRRIPDLNVRLGYTHDSFTVSGDQDHTVMVTLSVPLPVFDTGAHDAARAEGRVRELGHQTAALVSAGQADVTGLERRRDSLTRTLQSLDDHAVPKSAGVLDATEKAFNHGGVSMTDLLLARRTHIALLLTRMDLRFDLFNARSELRRVLGLDVAKEHAR